MKKEKIIFIISLVMMLLATSISVYATSCLYNSSDVSYTAPSGSGLSANVQDSLTEVYGHCTDYTSMDTRVSSLEGHFLNNATSVFSDDWLHFYQDSSNDYVGLDFYDKNNVRRGVLQYNSQNEELILDARSSNGVAGTGSFNINGNPVKINETDISTKYSTNITPLVGSGSITLNCYMGVCILKVGNYNPGNITSRTSIGTLPSGYRPVTEMTEQMNSCIMGAAPSGNIWMDPACANQARYQNITYTQWY